MREFQRAVTIEGVVGRVIEGRVLTYDRAYHVVDPGTPPYLEGWRAGAFTAGIANVGNTVEARLDHADQRAGLVSFLDTARSLDFAATVDRTPVGDDLLANIDEGRVRAVSLRFTSAHQRPRQGVVWRTEATPRELSFVVHAARAQYDDALITARRAVEVDQDALDAAAARAQRTATLVARAQALMAQGAALG